MNPSATVAAAAAKKKKKKTKSGAAKRSDDGFEVPAWKDAQARNGGAQASPGTGKHDAYSATAQAQADLLATASDLYRRIEADPQGIPDDDAYWTSLPAHLRTFIRNALPLGQFPPNAQINPNDPKTRQASTQAMIAVAQQLAQAAHASQRHLQQYPPGTHPYPALPFDPSIFADLALHPDQALPLHPHPNFPQRSATGVNPPPTQPPGEPLPAPLVNEFGDDTGGESGDDYYIEDDVDDMATDMQGLVRGPNGTWLQDPDKVHAIGEQTAAAKKKNKKKKKKSGAEAATPAPLQPPTPPVARAPAATATQPAATPAAVRTGAPLPPSSRAAGKQPMTFTSNAAGKAPVAPRSATNGVPAHSHPPSSTAAGKRPASAAAASSHGPGSVANGPAGSGAPPRIWSTSSVEERERIKEFWLGLSETDRRSLVKVEKEAVLRKMKDQQKHGCSCAVCGRKRSAIEDELEVLYDKYYDELEQYANHQQQYVSSGGTIPPPPGPGPFPGSVALDSTGAVIDGNPKAPARTARGHTPASHPPVKRSAPTNDDDGYDDDDVDDEDDDYDYDDDEEDDEEDDADLDEPDSKSAAARRRRAPTTPAAPGRDFLSFGSSLTVKGGILTVADDLLKNDGQKFLEMMEQLAERRVLREEEAQIELEGSDEDDDLDDDEDDEDEEEEEDEDEDAEDEVMTESQRMEEGRRMFQIFAARMFEQRVLQAYREKVAQERQLQLLRELEEEDQLEKEREAKRAKENQKKKDKKKQAKQQKEEERLRRESEKAAEEAAAKVKAEKQREAELKKQEELRQKREAERKAQAEEKARKDEEKRKRLEEERAREAEKERKRKEKEDKARAEREAREAKEKEKKAAEEEARRAKELKDKEEAERKERERKAREQKEAAERAAAAAQAKANQQRAASQQRSASAASRPAAASPSQSTPVSPSSARHHIGLPPKSPMAMQQASASTRTRPPSVPTSPHNTANAVLGRPPQQVAGPPAPGMQHQMMGRQPIPRPPQALQQQQMPLQQQQMYGPSGSSLPAPPQGLPPRPMLNSAPHSQPPMGMPTLASGSGSLPRPPVSGPPMGYGLPNQPSGLPGATNKLPSQMPMMSAPGSSQQQQHQPQQHHLMQQQPQQQQQPPQMGGAPRGFSPSGYGSGLPHGYDGGRSPLPNGMSTGLGAPGLPAKSMDSIGSPNVGNTAASMASLSLGGIGSGAGGLPNQHPIGPPSGSSHSRTPSAAPAEELNYHPGSATLPNRTLHRPMAPGPIGPIGRPRGPESADEGVNAIGSIAGTGASNMPIGSGVARAPSPQLPDGILGSSALGGDDELVQTQPRRTSHASTPGPSSASFFGTGGAFGGASPWGPARPSPVTAPGLGGLGTSLTSPTSAFGTGLGGPPGFPAGGPPGGAVDPWARAANSWDRARSAWEPTLPANPIGGGNFGPGAPGMPTSQQRGAFGAAPGGGA